MEKKTHLTNLDGTFLKKRAANFRRIKGMDSATFGRAISAAQGKH
ncbi:hypothetical protein PEDI_53350 [Persicobacter diffluens]|uniref:Uncharacterized protein n=1 Tax=Persicobacter diffluens TaxID=981 RepID=A0AAN5AQE9_9BACT|nr:hypothetical protein PEDI_53350 [Persicobacter diffluens]